MGWLDWFISKVPSPLSQHTFMLCAFAFLFLCQNAFLPLLWHLKSFKMQLKRYHHCEVFLNPKPGSWPQLCLHDLHSVQTLWLLSSFSIRTGHIGASPNRLGAPGSQVYAWTHFYVSVSSRGRGRCRCLGSVCCLNEWMDIWRHKRNFCIDRRMRRKDASILLQHLMRL